MFIQWNARSEERFNRLKEPDFLPVTLKNLFGFINSFPRLQIRGKPLNEGEMSTVAEQLRAAREAKKSHGAAGRGRDQNPHRPRPRAGRRDFSVFSAPIYIRGSVKNYAKFLKLDVPQVFATLDAELKGTQKFSEPPPLTENQKNLHRWIT
jgi:hypothetical protein